MLRRHASIFAGRPRARARGRRGCGRRRRARSSSSRASRRSRAPRSRSAARRARRGSGRSSARPGASAPRREAPLALGRVLALEAREDRADAYRRAFVRRRDLKQAEAHLVGRPLAPQHVARREWLAGDDGLRATRVVEAAAHADRVAGVRIDGMLEVVGVLPVEVPVRDVQQRLRARRAGIQLEADVDAAQVHVAGDAVDANRPVDGAVARRADAVRVADLRRIVGHRLLAEIEQPDRDEARRPARTSSPRCGTRRRACRARRSFPPGTAARPARARGTCRAASASSPPRARASARRSTGRACSRARDRRAAGCSGSASRSPRRCAGARRCLRAGRSSRGRAPTR